MIELVAGVVMGIAIAWALGRLLHFAWENGLAVALLTRTSALRAPIPLWWRLLAVLITGEDPVTGRRH